ncbi:hypothetical protein SKAU_G00409400 [Synaphobranchus kaupii]|uniref:Uncharacterized protein n=1 Tax=Synaphobranchus kaupii TaxID=118154 RepID=A0A9Q1EAP4_SYNKA|nr:hypothetical protein SKAU_G00409400 [Synaphobranchus kaupii]
MRFPTPELRDTLGKLFEMAFPTSIDYVFLRKKERGEQLRTCKTAIKELTRLRQMKRCIQAPQ